MHLGLELSGALDVRGDSGAELAKNGRVAVVESVGAFGSDLEDADGDLLPGAQRDAEHGHRPDGACGGEVNPVVGLRVIAAEHRVLEHASAGEAGVDLQP